MRIPTSSRVYRPIGFPVVPSVLFPVFGSSHLAHSFPQESSGNISKGGEAADVASVNALPPISEENNSGAGGSSRWEAESLGRTTMSSFVSSSA